MQHDALTDRLASLYEARFGTTLPNVDISADELIHALQDDEPLAMNPAEAGSFPNSRNGVFS